MSEPYYVVAVWWPRDGSYGGCGPRHATLECAMAEVEILKQGNYGHAWNPIHVIKCMHDEVVLRVDDGKEKS